MDDDDSSFLIFRKKTPKTKIKIVKQQKHKNPSNKNGTNKCIQHSSERKRTKNKHTTP